MYAARYNFSQVVEALLDHGAETNSRDSGDNTALHMAARNCSANSAQMILSKGVNVNWINSQGKTPLIEASEQGCFPIVKILTAHRGVDLAQKDNQMKTALDYAMEESNAEVGGFYSMIRAVLKDAGAPTSQWVTPIFHPKDSGAIRLAGDVAPLP
jgi:ankyrin repeat protein